MNDTVRALLEDLAAAHGGAAPLPAAAPGAGDPGGIDPGAIDLGDAGALIGLDEPALLARLRAAARTAAPSSAVVQRQLAACCGRDGDAVLCPSLAAAALVLHGAALASRPGATAVLLVGDVADLGLPQVESCSIEQVTAARLAEAALLLLAGDLPRAALVALQQQAVGAGVPVALDETRSAFRLAATTVAASLPQPPDFVLLGSAVAAGLPFAAVVGASGAFTVDAVTRCIVAAVLDALAADPPAPRLQQLDAELRAGIAAAAKEHDIDLELRGEAGMTRLHFRGQEGADGALIAHHFGLELAAAGCRAHGPLLLPAAVRRHGIGAVLPCLQRALLRVRALLIEYNSHLSGGIPYVFAGGDPQLRARGIARYRYPKLAAVDVDAHGSAMRIAFGAGDLGAVTSSGFYLPTRLRGDVEVSVRYEVHTFAAGPDATCLGLFLQDEPSTARYYAQLMSTAEAPDRRSVAAGFAGALLGRTEVHGRRGWLRLCRRGDRITASHRDGDDQPWRELGSTAAVAADLIVGAKIWSKVRTDGLIAELHDLQVLATVPAEQPPLLEARPDPR